MIKMDAQLHAILTHAGMDPAAFALGLADRDPFGDAPTHNSAAEIVAARPDIGIVHVNAAISNGVVELYSLSARDGGGKVEIMRIGDAQNVTFTQIAGTGTPFGLTKGGPRDLRAPRSIDSVRQPATGKPAWLSDASGQAWVSRHLGSDTITVHCATTYVDVDAVLPNPYADEQIAA